MPKALPIPKLDSVPGGTTQAEKILRAKDDIYLYMIFHKNGGGAKNKEWKKKKKKKNIGEEEEKGWYLYNISKWRVSERWSDLIGGKYLTAQERSRCYSD